MLVCIRVCCWCTIGGGHRSPRLIGVDANGDLVGTPALLMTELPGRPAWTTNLRWVRQLVEVFLGPVPDQDCTFIYRDFYPGNVLWHRRVVSGLVDWEAASLGLRSMDVAHFGSRSDSARPYVPRSGLGAHEFRLAVQR
ncbi:MAG: phosphotransferase [Ilumatobacteraceae bacterium]